MSSYNWVSKMRDILKDSAYGGTGWSPRRTSLREEIGNIWGKCGVNKEWSPLEAVLLIDQDQK